MTNYFSSIFTRKKLFLLDKIKKEIDNAEVISFDIFDTLLLRPYCRPVDLFSHIGKIKNLPYFSVVRQNIEKETRKEYKDKEDITLSEIYKNIDDVFKPLQEIEASWEEMVLSANPELKQVYDYALKQKKKIIIVSDMYLSAEFLAKVLRKNGFDNWDKLYVSSEIKLTKASGNLFKKILDDLKNIPASKFLHIGDNYRSDYKKPKKYGIRTVLYEQVLQQFIQKNKGFISLFHEAKENLGISILLAFLANRWQQKRFEEKEATKSYWQEVGYLYAGPLAYGYSRFIERTALENKLDFLAFVARDGYTLQRVFNLLNSNIKNEYIYAPRFLNLICRLDYASRNKNQTEAILDYFSEQDEQIKQKLAEQDLKKAKEQHKFIQDNQNLFKPLAKKNLLNYKKYLSSKIPSDAKVGLVDTVTGEFSSQKLLQSALGENIHGIYWSVIFQAYKGIYSRSCFINKNTSQDDAEVYTLNWNFIEFLLSSPEYPVKNINEKGQPIYENKPHKAEIYRSEVYPLISDAAVKFVQDVKSIFGNNDIFIDGDCLVKYINNFITHPSTKDIKEMVKIKFAYDSNHSQYIPLFSDKTALSDVLLHPKKVWKNLKKLVWRTPLQLLLVCLFKPISLKTKGIRKIEIVFFPYLKNQYLKVFFNLNSRWNYKFIVGCKEI